MRVRMKVSISGTHNGEDWPEVGGVADLPDVEARHLVAGGLAVAAPVEAAIPDRDVETATVTTKPGKRRRNG